MSRNLLEYIYQWRESNVFIPTDNMNQEINNDFLISYHPTFHSTTIPEVAIVPRPIVIPLPIPPLPPNPGYEEEL
ncbi:7212_t:CDS:2 [Ambispora gerdemannii]|uniref:7212_t:CDS:1 n=1 Tax=Ambispora gerdemannii TaxID=144530 RepID=A0A9N8V7A9_9GLOM|nr:7212_t:CDS:2 [Ambispora gerdemannii]